MLPSARSRALSQEALPSRRLLTRRRLLTLGGLSAGATVAAALPTAGPVLAVPPSDTLRGFRRISVTKPPPKLPADLYQLGVASGDPLPGSVVIWTRLAPKPLDGGGMP